LSEELDFFWCGLPSKDNIPVGKPTKTLDDDLMPLRKSNKILECQDS